MTYTTEQLELLAHIRAENETFTAQAKADGAVMIITPSDDIDMWIQMGANNIEQYTRIQLEGEISDTFKEVYGIRPGACNKDATIEQLQAELDNLHNSLRIDAEQEKKWKEEESRSIQARRARNKYKPNLAFAVLADLMSEMK